MTIYTPLETNVWYSPADNVPLSYIILYQTIVGNLVYLTITYLDITYADYVVSYFVTPPTTIY